MGFKFISVWYVFHNYTVIMQFLFLAALRKPGHRLDNKSRIDGVYHALGEVLKRMPQGELHIKLRSQRIKNGKTSRSVRSNKAPEEDLAEVSLPLTIMNASNFLVTLNFLFLCGTCIYILCVYVSICYHICLCYH